MSPNPQLFSDRFKPLSPEEQKEAEQRRAAIEAQQRHAWAGNAWLQSNCPARHRKFKMPESPSPWRDTLGTLQAKLGTGFLITLMGAYGNGKTQLGVEIIRHHVWNNFKAGRYLLTMDFLLRIKSSYRHDAAESEEQIQSELARVPLLVIDELDRRLNTQWEDNPLSVLIDKRYFNLHDTLIISNQTPEDLTRSLGPAIISRMQETGGIIECNWASFRG